MHFILIGLLILAALMGPRLWTAYLMRRYRREREDLPGTGGELAQHLLTRFQIHGVGVEATDLGDHYDPDARMVRLNTAHFDSRSLTAVAVAAHEVGHAIQHYRKEPGFRLRDRWVRIAATAERYGAFAMMGAPVLTLLTRHPAPGILLLLVGLASLGGRTLVHLITLPVELDASFGKALPILREGRYLATQDEPVVRRLLRAAALTYVAASLASLLSVWRWLRILRR